MKKKTIVVLLALLMVAVLALTGCGGDRRILNFQLSFTVGW